MWREFRLLWLIIAVMLGGLLASFAVPPKPAYPHDAPSGWSYDLKCCSGVDCREVDGPAVPASERHHSVQVIRIDGGYQISTTGERIMDGDPRIKDSPDGEFHWCSQRGGRRYADNLHLPPAAAVLTEGGADVRP